MFVPSMQHFYLLFAWLTNAALAQPGDCDEDGATSTYNQNGLTVPFDNLCGRDIEAALDYALSSEQRRSDCLDRCVRQAPLCYGFDYTPYVSSSQINCYLMNGTFPASNATERSFVANAAMLNPAFRDQLPEECKALGLRECFKRNGPLGSGTSGLATSTVSSPLSTSEASATTSPPALRDQQKASEKLSSSAKAGIGAGVGLVALIAILCGLLFLLKRAKRKRATKLSTEAQQGDLSDTNPPHKMEAQIYARMATSSPGLATSSPALPTAILEQVHEIDGHTRHEKCTSILPALRSLRR
ncbi:hypothetical protein E8E13_007485 [Curvularia kusanoi]|uniref:Apple domain-containing protein n=1 Tax=Curvularia kusanoi TaxID=90978 RepID=A0A9P4W516_CURKU|nr:hypothetical protein E8E13_007485 [Curvularia kusanoi]